ncbi:MAG: DUF3943 domain-containing protein [Gemmatimonadales bacterium]
MSLPTFRRSCLVLAGLLLCARVEAQEPPRSDRAEESHFWQAAAGVVAVNGLTWFYNWRIQRWDWANVGTRSWWANIRRGFTWDDDVFGANQVAHPYHGSLYFNAARSSGYGFWASTPFVAAGSLGWELFTENVRPSINDLINTTLGGIALGEAAYRMSSLLTSKGAFGREMGAFVVSPVARTHAFLRGHGRRRDTALGMAPESSSALVAVGQRRGTGASPNGLAGSRAFVGLTVQYGSAFGEHVAQPYDAFEFSLHLSPEEHVVLSHVGVSGVLSRRTLVRSKGNHLFLALFQHYDYDDLPAFKSSSQSLSGALLYRRHAGARTDVNLGFHLEAVPLGAVSSEYKGVRRRDYDYGPGLGGRFLGSVRRDGRDLLRLDARTVWIHSVHGAAADHLTATARISALIPVMRVVGLGGDVGLTVRRSSYREMPHVTRRTPQLRAYLVWLPS